MAGAASVGRPGARLARGRARAFERRLRPSARRRRGRGRSAPPPAIVFEAAEAAGVSACAALDATILREELGTRFGTVWGLAALAWLLLGLAVLPALRRRDAA